MENLCAAQIERAAERKMDNLDRQFLAGEIAQAEYEAEIANLNKWVEQQYAARAQQFNQE